MVTQKQIADELGVSRQLVNFALSGYQGVAENTRATILATAKKLGYQPNIYARALREKQTGIIALWVPDQVSSHYYHVAYEMGRLAKASDSELIISKVNSTDASKTLSHVPVDAIIAVDTPKAVIRHLEALKSITVISIGAYHSRSSDHVHIDLLSGTKEVVKFLIRSGFRRIAHATSVHRNDLHESRRRGYQTAMQGAKLDLEFIYYPVAEKQRLVSREVIRNYINDHGCPEAIFCHSDDVAIGIYRGLCDLKIRVPEQVALVGCDGIEDAEYLECPLSTLEQPVEAMCATTWRFLQKRIQHPSLPTQQATLKTRFIIRESSTGPGAVTANETVDNGCDLGIRHGFAGANVERKVELK